MGIMKFFRRSQDSLQDSVSPLSPSQAKDADGDELLIRLFRAHNMISSGNPTLYSTAAYEIIAVRREMNHAYNAGRLAGDEKGAAERKALAVTNDSLRFENESLKRENQALLSSSRKMLLFLAEQQAKGKIDKVPRFDDLP